MCVGGSALALVFLERVCERVFLKELAVERIQRKAAILESASHQMDRSSGLGHS